MEADLESFSFPVPVLDREGPVITGSSTSTRSEICTFERMIPIWTNRKPLLSGLELTVPFRFMLRTLTESPRERSDGLRFPVRFRSEERRVGKEGRARWAEERYRNK